MNNMSVFQFLSLQQFIGNFIIVSTYLTQACTSGLVIFLVNNNLPIRQQNNSISLTGMFDDSTSSLNV